MPGKVVMVLCDGVGDAIARSRMGYLEHLVEEAAATRYTSKAVLPTMSRPNYESLHTGVPPNKHGKTSNHVPGASDQPNVFSAARAAGLTTAAVAYHWFSELYHESPFDPVEHLEYDDGKHGITYGRFYQHHAQPDSEMILRGALLAKRYEPDYMLVHPMGVDHAGHDHGVNSSEYAHSVSNVDELLAVAVPLWVGLGYSVIVTADHGHDEHKSHGGTEEGVRNVPLYAIPRAGTGRGDTGELISHLQVAPTICSELGIPIPGSMTAAPFTW